MAYWRKGIDKKKLEPKRYSGKVTGVYADNQSRMLVEVTFQLNGKDTLLKKSLQQITFTPKIGDDIIVEFFPKENGVITNIRKA